MGSAVCRRASGAPKGGIQCGVCAAVYELGAWQNLAVVRVLTGEAITVHVVKWPHGVRIEIRRCSRCGGPIARTEGAGRL
jgi:hypothetical protein